MKKQSAFWKDIVKPVLVLVAIGLIAALLLAYVNSITAPVIAENARIAAEQTRISVLPGAESFAEYDGDLSGLDVESVYIENAGRGYVITSVHKGYKGDVRVTVGLGSDGKIVGIAADVSTETSGVGTKAGEDTYLGRFMGLSTGCDSVDIISNATYSSSAVKKGVQAVLAAYQTLFTPLSDPADEAGAASEN